MYNKFLTILFQRFGQYASMLLLLLLIANAIFPDVLLSWSYSIGSSLAIIVGIAFCLNVWYMIEDWQKGRLFLIQNVTFYVAIFTVLCVCWMTSQHSFVNQGSMGKASWWIMPLILFFYSQNLSRVRMDDLSLEVHLGAGNYAIMPLFDIAKVDEKQEGFEIIRTSGEELLLKRKLFTKHQWKRLSSRLSKLG